MLETDIAAAELRIKQQSETQRLQQLQSQGSEQARRARYNRKTGAIEDVQ
jgi:hypothetical protein